MIWCHGDSIRRAYLFTESEVQRLAPYLVGRAADAVEAHVGSKPPYAVKSERDRGRLRVLWRLLELRTGVG